VAQVAQLALPESRARLADLPAPAEDPDVSIAHIRIRGGESDQTKRYYLKFVKNSMNYAIGILSAFL
jgi:hypothetical protein